MLKKTFEKNTKLSQSMLWHAQRDYYSEQGVEAWADEVPFYVTSNPFIADYYANIIFRFIQDWCQQNSNACNHPFYIVELGTGSGQLSYYLLKKLTARLQTFNLAEIKFKYVMTDFTMSNVEFWRQHNEFKPFLQQGNLDFATFDLEHDATIKLLQSGEVLDKNSITNPLIVIANYLFDSIPHDAFAVKNKELFASSLNLSTDHANLKNGQPKDWEQIQIDYQDEPVNAPYPEEIFNDVLQMYATNLNETRFLFPVVGLRALAHLRDLSHGKLLLISSDKGYTTLTSQDDVDEPHLDFHGSFSVMVNYHAIAEYFKRCEGEVMMQIPHHSVVTGVFASGLKLQPLMETSNVLMQMCHGFSPVDYFNIYEQFEEQIEQMGFDSIISLLALSNWDSHLFAVASDRLHEVIDDADLEAVRYLLEHLPNIAANYYHMPEAEDVFFDIGVIYQEQQLYQEAIPYYNQSRDLFGDNYAVSFNLGYCYSELGNIETALIELKKALDFDSKSKDAKKILKEVNEKYAATTNA